MSSQPIQKLQSKQFVLLLIYTLTITLSAVVVIHGQELRQGVSVQMARTANAVAYPAADNNDAWIVAINADGRLFFGTKPVTPDQLFDEMKATPRQRDARLYIKADARSKFSSLLSALREARSVEFEQFVLLTSQHTSAAPGKMVSPEGIAVQINPHAKGRIDVRLSSQGRQSTLTVDGKPVSWAELGNTLKNQQHGPDQVVLIDAADSIPFDEVIRAMDEARKVGATPGVLVLNSI
jgi:biopolymer transport protein ExbD